MTTTQHPYLGESELILSHGRIYHLDLHPDDIADTIITVGDPNRVAHVSKYFDSIELSRAHREFVTHTGYIGKQRLSVVSTGISTDNIDIVLNELDALRNICFTNRCVKDNVTPLSIVRLGTSGAIQADIPVDSFVLSKTVLGFDGLMHFYDALEHPLQRAITQALSEHFGQALPVVPHYFEASPRFQALFSPFTIPGTTVTCGGFYAPQGRILRAAAKYPHFIDALSSFDYQGQRLSNFEMETAGIYGLSHALGFECCSISAIINNRATKTFSTNTEKSLHRLIQTTLEHLTNTVTF